MAFGLEGSADTVAFPTTLIVIIIVIVIIIIIIRVAFWSCGKTDSYYLGYLVTWLVASL